MIIVGKQTTIGFSVSTLHFIWTDFQTLKYLFVWAEESSDLKELLNLAVTSLSNQIKTLESDEQQLLTDEKKQL